MTLSASLYRENRSGFEFVSVPEVPSYNAAGFECYRSELWGSDALAQRGATFLPRLRSDDLYVPCEEFTAFKDELDMIASNALDIAGEIWPRGLIESYCPIRRADRIRCRRVRGARDIRNYVFRFRYMLNVAERHKLGFMIG